MDLPDKTAAVAPPKKEIKPVVSGAKKVQRPASKRFFDYLFAESPKDLARKVGRDVIVPRIKAGFEQAANEFLSGMLWGNGSNRPPSNIVQGAVIRPGGGINYNGISSPSSLQQARAASTTTSSGNYSDVTVPTQEFAETLLANLYDLLNQYRVVAVADLYEAAGLTSAISDNAYGWTSLDGARIIKVRDGYLLELPRPTIIST
jgi:hypothetical protein